MRKVPITSLVVDFSVYPRTEVNAQSVHYLAEAIESGAELPPILVEKKSMRIVDGVHRYRAYKRVLGEEGEVMVIEKAYKSEADLYNDAMDLNAHHGSRLTTFDRTHCVIRALELGLDPDQIAKTLSIKVETVMRLTTERTAKELGVDGKKPLKRTIQHKAGDTLTRKQWEANDKLSGMEQLFHVNQILILIDNDLVDTENEHLIEGLERLAVALKRFLGKKAA